MRSTRPPSDVDALALRKFVERGRAHGRMASEHESVEETLEHLDLIKDGRCSMPLKCCSAHPRPRSSRWASSHRVWHKPGYLQIDIYHDAVEILNPGWFIEGQDPEAHLTGASSSSSTRNELIASTLYRSGDIESSGMGMGMKKIKDLCDAASVKVDYERVPFGTRVTFHRNDPFAESSQDNGGTQGVEVRESLSAKEAEALNFIEENGSAPNKEVAHAIGLSTSGSLKLLRRLAEKGPIESHGEGKSTSYVIASPFDD